MQRDLLLSCLGRRTDCPFPTQQMAIASPPPPPFLPLTCSIPSPSLSSSQTAAPHLLPLFDCNLPQPLLVVGFPILGLIHPVSYGARLETHRQAVTRVAEKKQCSMRKKEKELSCFNMLKMHLYKKVYLLACFLLHNSFLACFIDECVILLLLLLLLIINRAIIYLSLPHTLISIYSKVICLWEKKLSQSIWYQED